MQFQVPQFIEIEDKIFGPLTIRQFIYIAGAAGIVIALFFTAPLFVTVIVGLPVAALGGALAFYKVNNRPFIYLLEAAFYYLFSTKLYIWKKQYQTEHTPAERKKADTTAEQELVVPGVSERKLKDLAWSLDIKTNSTNR